MLDYCAPKIPLFIYCNINNQPKVWNGYFGTPRDLKKFLQNLIFWHFCICAEIRDGYTYLFFFCSNRVYALEFWMAKLASRFTKSSIHIVLTQHFQLLTLCFYSAKFRPYSRHIREVPHTDSEWIGIIVNCNCIRDLAT